MRKNLTLVFLLSVFVLIISCSSAYEPDQHLTSEQYDIFLRQLAPYVHKKPDALGFEERFLEKAAPYYRDLSEKTDSRITHFKKSDSVNFFFFEYRDLTSLYEHYRGMGGYFKTKGKDSVELVNLLYHTPRLTREEMQKKSDILFREMVSKGNVLAFVGNRSFIHTPNDDFYYNIRLNRWDYTENSSWNFLREEQERSAKR